MLEEVEKNRGDLDAAIADLRGRLEGLMTPEKPTTGDASPSEITPRSELKSKIEMLSEKLISMRQTVESICNRLDIPD